MRRIVVTSLSIAASFAWSGAARGLDVPISVQELTPQGVAGRERGAQVVSAGVPLLVQDGITGVGQLGMSGSPAAQFRVLHRDPNTNEIEWVLATFIATHPGGPYALRDGSGAFGGPDLASDQGARIVVNTGAATFEVRKSGFNLLDRVVHGGSEIVAPHAGGGIVLVDGGTRYESSRDVASVTVIEENGPVMAVVRSRGVLVDAFSNRHVGYTARLHFYKGMSRCRAFVTLTNGELASLSAKSFDAAWVELPLQLAAPRDVRFGFPAGDFEDMLGAGETAHLFQGDNTFQRNGRTDWLLPYMCTAAGLEVSMAGAAYNTLGSVTDVAEGWVRIQDNSEAVLAGVRDMATLFPSGFHVQGGLLAVEMFSRHNPLTGLVFSWGCHETREMLFDFAGAGADPQAFRYDLQYPLLGRCAFERYRDTGAIYGQTSLVTTQEEQDFFADQGQSWSLSDYTEDDIEAFRQYSFGTTGGGNQFDKDLTHLLDYLRTGHVGRFLQARLGATWKADQAVYHSDDFDYGARQNGVSDVDVLQPDGFHGKGGGSTFDDEHPHWVNMPIYYYMTGDERIRDAIVDYGEWRRYRAGNPTYGAINGGAISHFRLWSRAFRDVALLWEFTGEARYLGDTRFMAEVLTTTIEEGVGQGRNLERGYFYFGDEDDLDRRIHVFFLIEMLPIGAREAMRVLPAGDPWIEEIRDFLAGLAWFTLLEVQISPDAIGYPYGYYSAIPNLELGTRGDQTGIILTHGYEMSGDQRFIDEARELAYRVGTYQHELRWSEPSTHLRIHRWLHRDEAGAVLLDPDVQSNGNGTYTLQWTAPADAHSYIVKYGARPMVENLDFDQITRTSTFDPATTMNFWAAANVAGEPSPGAEGVTETYTTPVLPGGTWYFKVKALLGSGAAGGGDPPPPPPPPPPPGDPQACIVWRNADKAKTSLWLMDGTTVLPQSGPVTSFDQDWMVAATGDFNGDGHIDLVWRHLGDGTHVLLLMDETTALPGSGLLPTLASRHWTVAGTADFDGDGNTDLLWRHEGKGGNMLWLMDGATVRPESGPLPKLKDLNWIVAGTGDFDGDGNADVLWRHLGDGRNSMWLLDGTTILPGAGPIPTVANQTWMVAATADFDDDGRSDLLWRHVRKGKNSLWFMDGTTILPGSGALPVVDEPGWTIAGAADFDGDGYPDVLWHDLDTGDNLIWFMDGTRSVPLVEWTLSVNTSWTVVGVGD